jgi:hypothetical protein
MNGKKRTASTENTFAIDAFGVLPLFYPWGWQL